MEGYLRGPTLPKSRLSGLTSLRGGQIFHRGGHMTTDNKDPTHKYTVPEDVYRVPTRAEHAAKLNGLASGLGYGLEEGTFADLTKQAARVARDLQAASQSFQGTKNRPSPLGSADQGDNRSPFERDFEQAEQRLRHARRGLGWSDTDAGLWVPLSEDY